MSSYRFTNRGTRSNIPSMSSVTSTCPSHCAEAPIPIVGQATGLGLVPVPTAPVLERIAPGIRLGDAGDAVQLWPHRNGTDAMFVQLLTTA